MAILSFNQIRKGKVIVFEGAPSLVTSAEFLRKQQRRPVMKTTLKSIKTGDTKQHSFQQSDKVEEADLERKSYQFLYSSSPTYAFMDEATYDQVELNEGQVAGAARWLAEGEAVEMLFFDGEIVSIELPIKITRRIVEAPPGVKGDSSSNVTKDAVIEGGTTVKVPLFINEGDNIVVDTRDGSYVERA